MKKFIIDRVMILIAGAGIILYLCISSAIGQNASVVLIVITACIWSVWCKHILLLPFDIMLGKVCKTCFYTGIAFLDEGEFFRKRYCYYLTFYDQEKRFTLLVPIMVTEDDFFSILNPPSDRQITIVYYRLSKTILGYYDEDGWYNSLV